MYKFTFMYNETLNHQNTVRKVCLYRPTTFCIILYKIITANLQKVSISPIFPYSEFTNRI